MSLEVTRKIETPGWHYWYCHNCGSTRFAIRSNGKKYAYDCCECLTTQDKNIMDSAETVNE